MAAKVTLSEDYSYSPKLPDMYHVFGGSMAFTVMCVNNAYKRLPWLYKPMVNIPLYVGGGLLIAHGLAMMREKYLDQKVRLAEAFIQANHEDFAPPPRKTYGDVLWQWTARR